MAFFRGVEILCVLCWRINGFGQWIRWVTPLSDVEQLTSEAEHVLLVRLKPTIQYTHSYTIHREFQILSEKFLEQEKTLGFKLQHYPNVHTMSSWLWTNKASLKLRNVLVLILRTFESSSLSLLWLQTRATFQQQLSELEKLPEILKYTETQLAECHEQLMCYEKKNTDLCAMIADLRQLVRDWQKVPVPVQTTTEQGEWISNHSKVQTSSLFSSLSEKIKRALQNKGVCHVFVQEVSGFAGSIP